MKRFISLTFALLFIFTLSSAQKNSVDDKGFELSKNLEIFSSVYKNLQLLYVDDINPGQLVETAINAMLSSLDPYTNYIPEANIEDMKLQVLGQYGGIGALIHQNGDMLYISEPYEGHPADKAGLKAGDRIIEVNGQSTEGKNSSDVSNALRGQAGTKFTLKLERNGKTFEKELTREEIKIKPIPYYGLIDNAFGYIRLNEFTQTASKDVTDAFQSLKTQKSDMKGIIIDLRGNGGGLLNEAVNIVNLFVDRGQLIVSTKGKVAEKNTYHRTMNSPADLNIPLAVLVDGSSASASEIVAGSVQDLDRGIVIGQRTFGKGLVQNIIPLTYNSQMKITISKYYIPSGRCIQAIDYSHRDEDGNANKVPDSLKTAFKTKKGRTVYDGFGIEPDIEVEGKTAPSIMIGLVQKFLIFQYATKFKDKHSTIASASEFEITDAIYADFKNFLEDKEYDYSTATEKTLEILKTIAERESYINAIQSDIANLEKKLAHDKNEDLDKFREEISQFLKAEILTRYYYQKGRIEGSLKEDADIRKAIEVLSNNEQYNAILDVQK